MQKPPVWFRVLLLVLFVATLIVGIYEEATSDVLGTTIEALPTSYWLFLLWLGILWNTFLWSLLRYGDTLFGKPATGKNFWVHIVLGVIFLLYALYTFFIRPSHGGMVVWYATLACLFVLAGVAYYKIHQTKALP